MSLAPEFAKIGEKSGSIDVRLSYKIVKLFSEGLYASPNKAIEELVANSFDAGARRVQVLLSPNMHDQNATVVVIDDGEGMDGAGLKEHWLIGISQKRNRHEPPKGRQQIGRFGIGKLATYVLSDRFTHLSKKDGKYYSTSMDYTAIDKRLDHEVEPKKPIRIDLRELSEDQAKAALDPWTQTASFKAAKFPLFGKQAPESWTAAVMSGLKEKVHEIKPGLLEWVLRTALPLRDDFSIHYNGKKLVPSKAGDGLLKTWILGKELIKLPRPSPSDIEASPDSNFTESEPEHYGLSQPLLGRMTGYAEAYQDLLTGKSDEIGRSHGFFVYVRGRLINVQDGHFGIPPDELRHGTFGRFRLVIHIDGLDDELRSNRETMREGPTLDAARDVLRAVFYAVRPTIDQSVEAEAPGVELARKLAASPNSLSRRPIVDLVRAVLAGKAKSRYLVLPKYQSKEEQAEFLATLDKRAAGANDFVDGLDIGFDYRPEDGIAKYDTSNGRLYINAWHPFVAAFYEEYTHKGARQPLEILAMAEVLLEAHLNSAGIKENEIDVVLYNRDLLLRNLAQSSGRRSALSVSNELQEARNSPDGLETKACIAFESLGFAVTPIGGKDNPDGVGVAALGANHDGKPRRYSVSIEAKSKIKDEGKVSSRSVGISAIARQRDEKGCDHCIVIGRAFPTTDGQKSAVAREIKADREATLAMGTPKTITLITIDDLARLVRLRPIKNLGLEKLRELFNCSIDSETRAWIDALASTSISRPPYRKIIETIHELQNRWQNLPAQFGSLIVALDAKGIKYEHEQEIRDLCKGMEQMAPLYIHTTDRTVELDQSAENVIAAIESATRDYA